ncbi:VIT-domain-containing protein [Viridothelium virens]|uniref:VIT-domain-containing protein n=1 Tax=Viridothelium virens TaxID=1048519 RepID=A0A6A6HJZ3_VIRVR|nr:VIT-domain-containing protein [Viridothelium virens]
MVRTYHICGCYYTTGPPTSAWGYAPRTYLPQVELKSHSTILSTSSRTVLTQTFSNPSSTKGIKTLRYTFPLYDGVSVVDFECTIGDRKIHGVVKEKEKARAVFQEAVDQGQQAGLLEQLPDASDVFTTTVGNVPPSAKIVINITYLGELKNDAEVDGIRFTIPTKIAPRYGSYPGQLAYSAADAAQASKGMEIIVDASMPEGSFIKAMQSPSHRLAVSIGTLSSAPNAEPRLNQASASLTLGSTELDSDFVLQVLNKDTGSPKAMLERHPMIPNQRALAVSLVPRFSLPQARPEIVFVVDRSGSMRDKIPTLVSALRIFLKSLPVGVMFNICSFGSSYSFLWQKSKTYDQSSLDVALAHVQSFGSDYGGTNMYQPIEATINNRYGDLPLEVVFLTDGQVTDQELLFNLLNRMVGESKAPIRFFTLGIGSQTSHALLEGVARAGNGFSQSVKEGEKLDRKVVRMLKGALTPHVSDYSLEVRYKEEEGEDFELVDKIEECLNLDVLAAPSKEDEEDRPNSQPISLFDANADPDKDENPGNDEDGQKRYSHLPTLSSPKILQAPNRIPPLFSFIRTSVYLLLSPETIKKTPKSVILKASSQHGPLQIEIPVQVMETPGETIHQLAAKKAVQELEEGRGWIFSAKDQATGSLLKDKMPGQFPQMVEREAVKLGVQFQVGGKFCSFVAVEANDKKADKEGDLAMEDTLGYEFLDVSNQTINAKTPHDMPSIRAANAQKSPPRFQMMSTASTQSTNNDRRSFPQRHSTRSQPSSNNFAVQWMPQSGQAQQDTAEEPMEALISLQTFEGPWGWTPELFEILGITEEAARHGFDKAGVAMTEKNLLATSIVICFFRIKLASEEETWELVLDKAVNWIENQAAEESRSAMMATAEKLVQSI